MVIGMSWEAFHYYLGSWLGNADGYADTRVNAVLVLAGVQLDWELRHVGKASRIVPKLTPVHWWKAESDRTDYKIDVCCGWITKLIYLINGTLIDKISYRLETVI
jgi:hypothetical protein